MTALRNLKEQILQDITSIEKGSQNEKTAPESKKNIAKLSSNTYPYLQLWAQLFKTKDVVALRMAKTLF